MLEDGYEYYGSLFDELDEKAPKYVVAEAHEQIKEDDLPTIKHGHWVKSLDHYDRYMCSVCGHLTYIESDNYCSYCGTKMDEVTNEID